MEEKASAGDGPSPYEVTRRIQDAMWWHAMICQDEVGLTRCLETLEDIADRDLPRVKPRRNSDLFRTLELSNLWQTAQIVATVSRERRESRGPHHRSDCPEPIEGYAGSYLVEPVAVSSTTERIEHRFRLVNLSTQ
jgi:succinate dehydrogenase/fumarate reductase flavoprotein subunit